MEHRASLNFKTPILDYKGNWINPYKTCLIFNEVDKVRFEPLIIGRTGQWYAAMIAYAYLQFTDISEEQENLPGWFASILRVLTPWPWL